MGVVTEGVKHSMNPFDEIALEEVSSLQLEYRLLKYGIIATELGNSIEREENSQWGYSSELWAKEISGIAGTLMAVDHCN